MRLTCRLFACAVAALSLLLAGCAATQASADSAARAALAPTGSLRVGVYPGSPTSLVRNPKTGEPAGITRDLGLALGERLGVPVQLLMFSRVAEVVDAIKDDRVDFTVTNASEARTRIVDFSPPVILLELGYLVPAGSRIGSVADVDRPGMRIGVTQGSTSQTTLKGQFKSAALVPAASMAQARTMLQTGAIDAFATNKGILFELADGVPQARVLDGRWGVEHLAIAIPKGRSPAALAYLNHFADEMRSSGRLQSMIARAGLRGTAVD